MSDEGSGIGGAGSPEKGPEVRQAVISGVATAAVTAGALPLDTIGAIVAAGLGPPVALAVTSGISALHDHIAERRIGVLDEACSVANVTSQEALESIQRDPQKSLVFGLTMDAAARTIAEEKLKLLGRVLANVLATDDPTTVDRERLIIDTIASIEPPHINVLRRIEERYNPSGGYHGSVSEVALADLFSNMDEAAQFLAPILRTLNGAGLVWQQGVGGNLDDARRHTPDDLANTSTWTITSFGVTLLARLRTANS
jgi:hypothetical protein